jgi:hypothetical protein
VAITAKVNDCASYNDNATAMDAVPITTADQSFATSSEEVSGDTVTMCHGVAISATTPAGVYSQTELITIVSNY